MSVQLPWFCTAHGQRRCVYIWERERQRVGVWVIRCLWKLLCLNHCFKKLKRESFNQSLSVHSGETYLVMKIDEIVCVCVNWMCKSEAEGERDRCLCRLQIKRETIEIGSCLPQRCHFCGTKWNHENNDCLQTGLLFLMLLVRQTISSIPKSQWLNCVAMSGCSIR